MAITASGVVDAAPMSCSFVAGNTGAIAFSAIDPTATPGPVYATVTQQVSFTCTKNQAYTIAVTPGSGWTLASGTNTMAFTLGVTASGTYAGAAVNLFLPSGVGGSSIVQTDYQNAVGGNYANGGAITVTVSWGGPSAGSIIASLPAGSVTGTIINTCQVTQSAGVLQFAIDPSTASTTASLSPAGQDLKIKCTKSNVPNAAVTSSSACGGLAQNGPGCGGFTIPYTFNFSSSVTGAGFGSGNDISLGIGGSASQAGYANAPGGTGYADIQTVTITY